MSHARREMRQRKDTDLQDWWTWSVSLLRRGDVLSGYTCNLVGYMQSVVGCRQRRARSLL